MRASVCVCVCVCVCVRIYHDYIKQKRMESSYGKLLSYPVHYSSFARLTMNRCVLLRSPRIKA